MVLQQEQVRAPQPPLSPPPINKPPASKRLVGIIILLLFIIGAETAIIYAQSRANQRIEAQSEKALGQFLKSGSQAATGTGSNVLLSHVRFCWSRQICIDTDRLTAQAIPYKGNTVNFDDLKSFIVNVQNANVAINPQTLQGMFNESVFNYPGSNLRDLTVGIEKAGGQNHVKLAGSLKYLFLWIPFEMDTNLSVDRKTNTLVIAVNNLQVFGIIPATWLIEFKPFNLQKLLTLPPNKHLIVRDNLMMVKPFGLFPPPRVNGTISGIAVTPKLIRLGFSGKSHVFDPLPPGAPNYIYLEGGNTRFGRLGMNGSEIRVLDRNPKNAFQFSLMNYLSYLPGSDVKIQPDGSVEVVMSDHQTLAEHAVPVQPPAPTTSRVAKQNLETGKNKAANLFDKAKAKTKQILGL